MDHTHIVRSDDLSRYAKDRSSQEVIPELISRLLEQSVPHATVRMPYGNSITLSGWDGIVKTDASFLGFVPTGNSYWEIGTGDNPLKKASADFKKRTAEINDMERANSSFILVTPRLFRKQDQIGEKQRAWKNKGWQDVKIIDGVILANWLLEFPAIGQWMAKEMGITSTLGGITTPREHWDLICSQGDEGDPPIPPILFTTSREEACNALEKVFAGTSEKLLLLAESEDDVDDFVAAYIATLEEDKARGFTDRCLFINDEDAWRSISARRQSHVLVANPRLGLELERKNLQSIATQQGHGIIIPFCGVWSSSNPKIIKLGSPSADQIETVLREAKFPITRIRELGGIGGGRISALRRYFFGQEYFPPYAKWGTARQLAQASLAGRWNSHNKADVNATAKLLGQDYKEWIEILRVDAIRSDSPLIQTDEKWRFVARREAWSALGNRITDDDLDRFKKTAMLVLGEQDPKFDLPEEERFAASIHGKELKHSRQIRKGLTETLALMGSRPEALTECSLSKAESTANLVVRNLLDTASWERWASLDSHLPLLAEASPSEFLKAVESAITDLSTTPFREIFAQEGSGLFGGGTYMSGLLWALEGLAWHADYLAQVSVILANIASIDPGGNYTNRPAYSLLTIFCPWHVQTAANFEKRKAAIKAVIQEQPNIGWSLLLALLRRGHIITNDNRMVWREFTPKDWKEGVTHKEYEEQIEALTELAVNLAKEDTEKLVELLDQLSDLPTSAHEIILVHISSETIAGLSEPERLPIWEKLNELVLLHRKFHDAKWALSEKVVAKYEDAAHLIALSSPDFKYRHLFSGKDFDLYNKKGNHEEQRERLHKKRQTIVLEIFKGGNLDAVLKFAEQVAAPYQVGRALGGIVSDKIEKQILPSLLDSDDSTLKKVVASFVGTRFLERKIDWVDAVLRKKWTIEHRAKFLIYLPFEREIWKRVSLHLGKSHEYLYWNNALAYLYNLSQDFSGAIEKLLKYGREESAVMCVAETAHSESNFNESLGIRTLIKFIESGSQIPENYRYHTVDLIERLQKSKTADQDALFQIEWYFLPLLGEFSFGSPITLEKKLSSDSNFFTKMIDIVFRPQDRNIEDDKEPSEKEQDLARNVYELLTQWKRCPGTQDDGSFNVEEFNEWVNKARELTEKSGRPNIAQTHIGQVLTHAPADPDGLWIHEAVATLLNKQNIGNMRSGFIRALSNRRGAYRLTGGREERKIASQYREKAEALNAKSHTRFAVAMRRLAERYDRDAERDEKRNPFED